MEPNFNDPKINFNENMIDDPNLPKISDKPYYEEPKQVNLKKIGFTSYFWVIFALFWTVSIFGVGYYAYINHWNLNGLVQVNNQYSFLIPVNNTNNNEVNVDLKAPVINTTLNIFNQINMTGNLS